mgnify:CR=1 FL=1
MIPFTPSPYFYSDDYERLEISGVRAYKYVYNNFIWPNIKGKYIFSGKLSKHSKVLKEFSCPFTGYCLDAALYIVFKKFQNDIKSGYNTTVSEFIDMVAGELSKEISDDYNYQVSDEAIKETIINNDYEFTQEGKIA